MSDVTIRLFLRSDREQVTALVNAHLAAILPGLSMSTNTVLGQFEREPDEYVADPWVIERSTLVCELKQRIVGAALSTYARGKVTPSAVVMARIERAAAPSGQTRGAHLPSADR